MSEIVDFTEGNVKKQLLKLILPMVVGVLGISIFNLVDTFFIAKLGTKELAAVTFTFPIILVLNGISLGISTGITANVAKVIGLKNQEKLKTLVFHSMIIAIIISIMLVIIGFLSLDLILNLLGAEEALIPIIKEYMNVWFFGIPFVVIPLASNGIIRAIGDTKTPAKVMIIAAVVNIFLDIIFIFGFWFIPALGVQGAAIATVISRIVVFFVSNYVLIFKLKILTFKGNLKNEFKINSKNILSIGLVDAMSKIIIPLGVGVVTGIIATYGTEYVAGYGVATKLENLIMMIAVAISIVVVPYCGQNIGTKNIERIRLVRKHTMKFNLVIQTALYGVVFITAPYLIRMFDSNEITVEIATNYLRIVGAVYVFKAFFLTDCSMLNVMKRPLEVVIMNLMQIYFLFIPLNLILEKQFGINGIFLAVSLSIIITFILSNFRVKRRLDIVEEEFKR